MSVDTQRTTETITYPESDGQPMAENTRQFRWIVTIQGGLDALFQDEPDVFVAGDLFWYPVEGQSSTCQAPDTMVVFGRPKGDRRSYQQWQEDNIAPQVVFEILSPANTLPEMIKKLRFYERYGVEEYYIYDPDRNDLSGWLRAGAELQEIPAMPGWVSPRLGVRFAFEADELQLYYPDGRRFATYLELEQQRKQAEQAAQQERQHAQQERQRAEQEHQRAERLAARLRALGIDPDATDDE